MIGGVFDMKKMFRDLSSPPAHNSAIWTKAWPKSISPCQMPKKNVRAVNRAKNDKIPKKRIGIII